MDKYKNSSKSKYGVIYSENFHRQVCEDYLQSDQTKSAIERKYAIGKNQVNTWLKKYGYPSSPTPVNIDQKKVDLDSPNSLPLSSSDAEHNADDLKTLQEENARLKKEIELAKIQVEGYELMLTLAEKKFNLPIRKKSNTK